MLGLPVAFLTSMMAHRYLVIAALLLTGTANIAAQTSSRPSAITMSATVLPNLKLQPAVFEVQESVVSARVLPQGPDRFVVQARITGGGKGTLQIPVWLSSNVKSFTLSASSSDSVVGTVRMTGAASEKINVLSQQKPLHSAAVFALGLPAAGRVSAAGTLNGTIEIALAEVPQGQTREFNIHLSISQNGSGE